MRQLPREAGPAYDWGAGVRLLVIAAHVDDEALLCGGTLHKAARRGQQARVVFCTRNQQGRWGEEARGARCERAESEAMASSARLGFDHCFLGFEDMRLADEPGGLLQALVGAIREVEPDIVISHSTQDWHIDHRTLGGLVPEAALQSGYRVAGGSTTWRPRAVLQGEVDLEGLAPFAYQLVSRLEEVDLAAKIAAVEGYDSLTTDHGVEMAWLRRSLQERAVLRGRTVGAEAGEAFAVNPLLPLDAAALRTLAELVE